MEAAGIEPASDSAPKDGLSRGFQAEFDFKTWRMRVTPGHLILNTWGGQAAAPLDEAIPQLEALLAAARLAQEA